MTHAPLLSSLYTIRESDDGDEGSSYPPGQRERFYKDLTDLAHRNGGKIPATHVTTPEGYRAIRDSGHLVGQEGTKGRGVGLYMTVGHTPVGHGSVPSWGREENPESVVIHLSIPLAQLHDIVPDPNWTTGSDYEDETNDFFGSAYDHGDNLEGADILLHGDSFPLSLIKSVEVQRHT